MPKQKQVLILLIAITLLGGCKSKTEKGAEAGAAESTTPQQNEPPALDVGLSVEQAYAAIPHRRTVWDEAGSTIPAEEKAYLRVIFEVVDQAVAVRVAGLQNFSARQFDNSDPAGNYDRLIGFVRAMPVPSALVTYHHRILEALAGQQQFFADWKSERAQFPFAQQIGGHAGVRNASAALRAAYNELMAKYPNESSTNKDAFFDYHCALDFL
jgi:hypothetical protein